MVKKEQSFCNYLAAPRPTLFYHLGGSVPDLMLMKGCFIYLALCSHIHLDEPISYELAPFQVS